MKNSGSQRNKLQQNPLSGLEANTFKSYGSNSDPIRNRLTSEGDIEDLPRCKEIRVLDAVQFHDLAQIRIELRGDGFQTGAGQHDVRVMGDRELFSDRVAAAWERDPQPLPVTDPVGVRDPIDGSDGKIVHETREHARGYDVKVFIGLDRVHRDPIRITRAVPAAAGYGDPDRVPGSDRMVAGGVDGERVRSQQRGVGTEAELGGDGGEGGVRGGNVADHGLASVNGGAGALESQNCGYRRAQICSRQTGQ